MSVIIWVLIHIVQKYQVLDFVGGDTSTVLKFTTDCRRQTILFQGYTANRNACFLAFGNAVRYGR